MSIADALLRHSAAAVLLTKLDGTILRANPAACAMLGRSEPELKRLRRGEILVMDEGAERLLAERDRTATGRGEVVLRRADGTTFPAELTSTIIARPVEPVALAIFRDISAQRRTAADLRESENRARARLAELEALYATAPVGLCVFDTQLRWLRLNQQLAEINGVPLAAHLGRTPREVVPDVGEQAEAALRTILETGEPLQFEMTGTTLAEPGVPRWWEERWAPIKDEHGGVVGISVAAEEITARKRAEEALRVADERKTNFLAVLSHELRNPLAAIRNGLSLLEKAPSGEQAARVRAIVRRQLEHVTRLVDDLLDISRINRGKLVLQRSRLDARELVRGACDCARAAFEERGVALRLELSPEPVWVDADETRLTQVVANLLGNALKFTSPRGTVDVLLRARGDEVELRVRDTGAGIEPSLLEAIFEPFAQAEPGRGTPSGGMGIGLALVKTFVTMHGGWVRALSQGAGKGAEFVVSLPLAAAAEVVDEGPTVRRAPAVPPVERLSSASH